MILVPSKNRYNVEMKKIFLSVKEPKSPSSYPTKSTKEDSREISITRQKKLEIDAQKAFQLQEEKQAREQHFPRKCSNPQCVTMRQKSNNCFSHNQHTSK